MLEESLPESYVSKVIEPLKRGRLVACVPCTRNGGPAVAVRVYSVGDCDSARHPHPAVREAFACAAISDAARDAAQVGLRTLGGSR